MRFNLNLFVTAAVSAVFGAVIFWGINNSQAQSGSAKESRFVMTGILTTSGGVQFLRLEDAEYNIVCYTGGVAVSCVKK
jgi:hypothetical protein